MTNLDTIIREAVALGCAQTMQLLGVSSGEISRRQAERTYGQWFRDAEAAGRIAPVRQGNGTNGTKWYSVTEILTLRTADEARALLQ